MFLLFCFTAGMKYSFVRGADGEMELLCTYDPDSSDLEFLEDDDEDTPEKLEPPDAPPDSQTPQKPEPPDKVEPQQPEGDKIVKPAEILKTPQHQGGEPGKSQKVEAMDRVEKSQNVQISNQCSVKHQVRP